MSTYATFTEVNEWEGETWRFYIPIEGNEEDLKLLKAAMAEAGDSSYHLDLTPIDEAGVDARVALGEGSYMAAHTKLSGRLVLAVDDLEAIANDDLLYKGGIEHLLAEDSPDA